jgi:hypothetical protein
MTNKIRLVSTSIPLELSYSRRTLKAGQAIFFDVLLNDYLDVVDTGEITFDCTMELKDSDAKLFAVDTQFSARFGSRLEATQSNQLVTDLEAKLNSSSTLERIEAVKSARILKNEKCIAVLKTALRDTDDQVQIAAVRSLAGIGGSEAISALKEALTDDSKAVRRAAQKALEAMKP